MHNNYPNIHTRFGSGPVPISQFPIPQQFYTPLSPYEIPLTDITTTSTTTNNPATRLRRDNQEINTENVYAKQYDRSVPDRIEDDLKRDPTWTPHGIKKVKKVKKPSDINSVRASLSLQPGQVVILNPTNYKEKLLELIDLLATHNIKINHLLRDTIFSLVDNPDDGSVWVKSKKMYHSKDYEHRCLCGSPMKHAYIFTNNKTGNVVLLGKNCRYTMEGREPTAS